MIVILMMHGEFLELLAREFTSAASTHVREKLKRATTVAPPTLVDIASQLRAQAFLAFGFRFLFLHREILIPPPDRVKSPRLVKTMRLDHRAKTTTPFFFPR